jgi:peptide-methionine (S)-S-oxide reductase
MKLRSILSPTIPERRPPAWREVAAALHRRSVLRLGILFIALLATTTFASASSTMKPSDKPTPTTERITLGGGCFWCLDAMFKTLSGVKSVTCGYAGGQIKNPTYKQVCSGETGHAEVVQVEFDAAQITLPKILEAFWDAHDPTTLNRQGADEGTQYRSIILYSSENQRAAAEQSKTEAAKSLSRPIVTEIVPLKDFFSAEDYHQDYFKKNPHAGYCQAVIAPKLKKFSNRDAKP